jgi:dipeptidyl-peptidase-4
MKRREYSEIEAQAIAGSLDDSLESFNGKWRRWKRFALPAAALCAAFTALVILSIVLPVTLGGSDDGPRRRVFEFDDIFSLSSHTVQPQWRCSSSSISQGTMANVSFVYRDTAGNLWEQTLMPNSTEYAHTRLLLNKTHIEQSGGLAGQLGSWFSLSPPSSSVGSFILLAANQTQRWRHSFFAQFLLYNLSDSSLSQLDPDPSIPNAIQMNPVWSPSGDMIAFVRENNIYLRAVSSSSVRPFPITYDGTPSRQPDGRSVVNGVQSWVYEEEVYSEMSALWWSPDGKRLAYLHFNETPVPPYIYAYYDNVYPTMINLAYPKPGYPNPIVAVYVYDLESNTTVSMDVGTADQYVSAVIWVDATTLAIRILNRLQNVENILLASVPTGITRVLKTRTSQAWLDTEYALQFLVGGSGAVEYFVDLVPNGQNYSQVALFNYTDGQFIRFITDPLNNAQWEVTSLLQMHTFSQTIYYTSNEESVLENHVYKQNWDGTGKTKLSLSSGWWDASVCPCATYLALQFSGNGNYQQLPATYLLNAQNPGVVATLENNTQLASQLTGINLPTKRYSTVQVGQYQLQSSFILPPDFSSSNRYPLLLKVYGGPGSQAVRKLFALGFDVYLASQGYIIAEVDGRGTGGRGDNFMHLVYLNLGKLETEDQIAAAKSFRDLSYVDENRVGVWGWSYGGYMTGMILSEPSQDVFSVGVSVAPVTDWRYYDSVYTERYMRTPSENSGGYTNSSVLNRVSNFKDMRYLLVHGTDDDNVHMQNSAELSIALVEANIQFSQMYYTNSDHSISNGNARKHLYRLISNYLDEHLA